MQPLKIYTSFTCERPNFVVIQFQGHFEGNRYEDELICDTPFEMILNEVKSSVEFWSFMKKLVLLKLDENTCILFENDYGNNCDSYEYLQCSLFERLRDKGFKNHYKHLSNMVFVLNLPTIEERETTGYTRFKVKEEALKNCEVYAMQDKQFVKVNNSVLV